MFFKWSGKFTLWSPPPLKKGKKDNLDNVSYCNNIAILSRYCRTKWLNYIYYFNNTYTALGVIYPSTIWTDTESSIWEWKVENIELKIKTNEFLSVDFPLTVCSLWDRNFLRHYRYWSCWYTTNICCRERHWSVTLNAKTFIKNKCNSLSIVCSIDHSDFQTAICHFNSSNSDQSCIGYHCAKNQIEEFQPQND